MDLPTVTASLCEISSLDHSDMANNNTYIYTIYHIMRFEWVNKYNVWTAANIHVNKTKISIAAGWIAFRALQHYR